jgi:hypothetical protein
MRSVVRRAALLAALSLPLAGTARALPYIETGDAGDHTATLRITAAFDDPLLGEIATQLFDVRGTLLAAADGPPGVLFAVPELAAARRFGAR